MIVFMQVRLITDQKERQKILLSCHRHPTSGQLGVRRTLSRIAERFMWTGVTKDVMRMVWPGTCLHVDAICTLCEDRVRHWLLEVTFTCNLQVAECHVCQKTGRKISKAAPALHCILVVSPWHHVGIDFIGPISPQSAK